MSVFLQLAFFPQLLWVGPRPTKQNPQNNWITFLRLDVPPVTNQQCRSIEGTDANHQRKEAQLLQRDHTMFLFAVKDAAIKQQL